MPNKKFRTFFDCGSSKMRAGTFNTDNKKLSFLLSAIPMNILIV